MSNHQTTIERAYELARSGEYANLSAIKDRLKVERFENIEGQLTGPALGRELRRLCVEAGGGQVKEA